MSWKISSQQIVFPKMINDIGADGSVYKEKGCFNSEKNNPPGPFYSLHV